MKNFKKAVVALCFGTALAVTPRPAAAQWLTTDLPHIATQVAEFAKKARDWVKTVENYKIIQDARSIAGVTKDISGRIRDITGEVRSLTEDGLSLQRQIREDLKKVVAIKDLKISNMRDLKTLVTNLANIKLGQALPSLGQGSSFGQRLASATDADAVQVKEMFNVVSSTSGTRRNVLEMQEQKELAVLNTLALENSSQQEKVAMAFRYKKMADEMSAQAVELQDGLNTPNKFSMTDGERVLAHARAADNMAKAQEYREKAESLLAASAVKGPTQLATEQAVSEQVFVASMQGMLETQHSSF
ncbi:MULTISPECIES: hypothetical protein [Hymenobacter]|uniref:Uncharacterized protein n=1 Tax=Hymenobacter guriensis TaxID=2793065 RepID=A0ABS0L833_9BACT|nr:MULTISPECIES: hypothetical protein [Hymenobacter]MBG8556313.1 hypothetical protein [Hymenobacter guriensis]MCR5890330.1 hypothetical protein [Hymenobacter sp. J193]